MAKKLKKSEDVIISINPMQDDLEKIGIGAAALERSLANKAVKATKESIKKGVEAFKKGKEKVGEKIYKAVGAESKFNKALMSKPKRTVAGMGATVVAKEAKKFKEEKDDITSREGSFKHGGLVRSGKPKLAKKGWR